MHTKYSQFLKDYFLKYSAITSQSDPSQINLPSSEGQMILAQTIKSDLESFGITDIQLLPNATVIAKIKGNAHLPPLSFMSHLDTVDIGESPDVHAKVIKYDGTDICLNEERKIYLRGSDYPTLNNYLNEEIIVTDGTSVLGADDKAGVTVMVGLAYYLHQNPTEHGDIYLIFVPDEEGGLRGSYAFDTDQLPGSVLSYTIDGGTLGEFGYETFNAAGANIFIRGVSIHPGSAKGIMVNPNLIVNEFISQFDPLDTPEHSEGKEGFFLITDIKGNVSEAQVSLIIRDFDKNLFEQRKQKIYDVVQQLQTKHPRAVIELDMHDSYANIANNLSKDRRCIDLAEEAMKNLNIEIRTLPIRGGTDGAVFSVKGIPTPNIFTGGDNFHSVHEFLPMRGFSKSLETVIEMVKISPKYK